MGVCMDATRPISCQTVRTLSVLGGLSILWGVFLCSWEDSLSLERVLYSLEGALFS